MAMGSYPPWLNFMSIQRKACIYAPVIFLLLCMVSSGFGQKQDRVEQGIAEEDWRALTVDSPLTHCPAQANCGSPSSKDDLEIDRNGYIAYCPCMGRFGNQAEQFLGAAAFAKGLNRTLILPPWVTYPSNRPFQSEQIPFTKWFKEAPLKEFHRVIPMERFMETLADVVWPEANRTGFCYVFRTPNNCAMKEGNPFGPFWDHFRVSFTNYQDHAGLLWGTFRKTTAEEWTKRFPAKKFPVLAFQGAPGDFPSHPENQFVQKYISFSDHLDGNSNTFIKDTIGSIPYLAIHLRNGPDVEGVCKDFLQDGMENIFASRQCTGHHSERRLTQDMCYPSRGVVIGQVTALVKNRGLKAVFVATDHDDMIDELTQALQEWKVKVHRRQAVEESDDPIVDIAIMVKADFFIGNCISTFSAFVRRQRQVLQKHVSFFGL